MNKRVMAWVLLIGFVLLLVNLIAIHIYWKQSLVVYLIICAYFLIFMNRKQDKKMDNEQRTIDSENNTGDRE